MTDQTTLEGNTDNTVAEDHLPNPEADDFYASGKEKPSETEASETSVEESSQEESKPVEGESQAESDQAEVPTEYKLALAEDTLLDKSDVKEISEYAKANEMSEEKAQEHLERQEKAVRTYAERQQEFVAEEVNNWKTEWNDQFKTDTDRKQSDLNVYKAMNQFAPEGFEELANKTGMIHHSTLRGFLEGVGKAMSDDSFESGGVKVEGRDTPLHDVFYDKTVEN